jgi:hypothetical protein
MKHLPVVLAFLVGATIASAVWAVLLVRCQIEMAVNYVSMADGEAKAGEHVLSYIDHPDPAMAHLLIFSASNHIVGFPHEVEYWDKRYPYMQMKQRSAHMIESFQIFLQTNIVLHTSQSQPSKSPDPSVTALSISTNK